MTTPRLLTRNEAAAYLTELGLKTASSTLAKLFCIGGGPRCRHAGRRPLYDRADSIEWFESELSEPRRSSSEPRRPATMKPGSASLSAA
jgi:hypothetical protein